MELLFEAIANQGIAVAGLAFFMWQNGKEKDKLMDFVNNQTQTLERINGALIMLNEDVRDIRRKVGIQKED